MSASPPEYKKYKVKVNVSAGYFVSIRASSPEDAARRVKAMGYHGDPGEEWFINTDRHITAVWDTHGNELLEIVDKEEEDGTKED